MAKKVGLFLLGAFVSAVISFYFPFAVREIKVEVKGKDVPWQCKCGKDCPCKKPVGPITEPFIGKLAIEVPPEAVVRQGFHFVAKEVVGNVTLTVQGKTYTGTVTFPDTPVYRNGFRRFTVSACTATGEVK